MTQFTRQSLEHQLQQQFGFDNFREGQFDTISRILTGHSALAIFPTGSGKSLCYQFSALHLPHLTLVVSPLLALIQDQISFLTAKGIYAASIDSTKSREETQQIMQDVRSGECKLLMVSVERFNNESFRRFLASLTISLMVVDEAHCISEWGHNFRPDYLKIPEICRQFAIPQVLLLTATATKKVKLDMSERFNISHDNIIQTGFYRRNLTLDVVPTTQEEKSTVLVEQIKKLNGAGIVYVTLQHTAEDVALLLKHSGINAQAYHAGMINEQRQQIQQDFMANRISVIVATIAFGMGIDKSDIRYVIHYDLPKSIENYSQEIGRAGRDGANSHCITLANLEGLATLENFVYGDTPDTHEIQTLIDVILEEVDQHQRWEVQDYALSKQCNIKLLPLKTLLVQLELAGAVKPSFAYFSEYRYQLLMDKETILSKFDPQRAAFIQTIFDHTQFKKVWGQLDFDGLLKAISDPRERVVAALDFLNEKQCILLETKKMTQVFNVNVSALNSTDIVEGLTTYVQDNERKEIDRIALLVRFFEQSGCLSYGLATYFDDKNAPKHCGHCSTCHGRKALLPRVTVNTPEYSVIQRYIKEINEFGQNIGVDISVNSQCKILTGLSVPNLQRTKVKQLSCYGTFSQFSFAQVKQWIL